MAINTTIIPEQNKGARTGATAKYVAVTRHEAVLTFERCKKILVNVNKWKQVCGDKGAEFQLTDEKGQHIYTNAVIGNLIRIKLPAPENPAGDGYDWVRIEAFETSKDLIKDEEVFGFRVRPAPNPAKDITETAHFYQDSATSSFLVMRANYKLSIAERGKNELPNKKGSLITRLRSWMIAIPAMLGFAAPQWKMLTKGILKAGVQQVVR